MGLHVLLYWPNVVGEKSEDPLNPDYVPSMFKHVSTPTKRRKKEAMEKYLCIQDMKQRRKESLKRSGAANVLLQLSQASTQPESVEESVYETSEDQTNDAAEAIRSEDPQQSCDVTFDGPCTNSRCIGMSQQFQELLADHDALRDEVIELKTTIRNLKFDEKSLVDNDDRVQALTGLPSYAKLEVVFDTVKAHLKTNSSVTVYQQIILALMRLRMNLPLHLLAVLFWVSVPTVSGLFNNTVDVMYSVLTPALVFWPEREHLRMTLPMSFRSVFKECACIVDCFEIFIDKPSDLRARAQTYSQYKHHNTIKYLIGITPQGVVSFISKGWGGRTRDKHITENSGFLKNLSPGDVILADRGFLVRDSVNLYNAKLEIPAFTKGKKQLSPVDVEATRGLAAVRIHVERVIGTVRQKYVILSATVPILV
ncbi:uncharacterized protein KZ484_023277 isoform 1-T1 [Pholidichthys leucotaenia]